ncbi:MAG: four helix bundle protein [Ignavibacteriota bacterium]
MGNISTYRELEVWKVAIELAVMIHKTTKNFPKDEMYGLTSQIRRAGYSVASNIAEGFGREHTHEYLHFLSIAKGSLYETETQIVIATKVDYIGRDDAKKLWDLTQRIGMMLTKLQQSLRSKIRPTKNDGRKKMAASATIDDRR